MRLLARTGNTFGLAGILRTAGVLLVVLTLTVQIVAVWAQSNEIAVEVGEAEHTVVEGQDVILIVLNSMMADEIQLSGLLSILDAGGLEQARVFVDTGPLVPDGPNVLAVPLPEPLPDGRYSLSLGLSDVPDGAQVQSGLRQFNVDTGRAEQSGIELPGDAEAAQADDPGFPAWIVLAAGLVLVTSGLLLRRDLSARRGPKPVPEVAMVRKVKLIERPARRPARIKPLRPPVRQSPDQDSDTSGSGTTTRS